MSHMVNSVGRFFVLIASMCAIGSTAFAQIEGPPRGIRPLASSGDFEVSGIKVDVQADSSDEARVKGWEEAQRLGWKKLWRNLRGGETSGLSDGTLNNIVSAVVVEEEQLGPKRYVATLGLMFDRARAGQLLGVKGITQRSAPLLVLPVYYSGGTPVMFEQRTPWQQAWAVYKTADSKLDYVRPSGMGAESLMLNAGQLERRNRAWMRVILDEFGAADVIIPIARIERKWPGGPVVGHFTARYGVENRYLGSFKLTVKNEASIPKLMEEGVKKIDDLYQAALASGRLKVDARLLLDEAVVEEEELDKEPAKLPTQNARTPGTSDFDLRPDIGGSSGNGSNTLGGPRSGFDEGDAPLNPSPSQPLGVPATPGRVPQPPFPTPPPAQPQVQPMAEPKEKSRRERREERKRQRELERELERESRRERERDERL